MIGWRGVEEEEVMELLWKNGPVVVKSQRSPRKPDDLLDLIPGPPVLGGSPAPVDDPLLQHQLEDASNNNNNLFIQEDEMSSWLFSDFCSDLLLPSAPTAATSSVPSCSSRPPPGLPPPKRSDSPREFSRPNCPRATPADEATVVNSSDSPLVTRASDDVARREDVFRFGAQSASMGVRDVSDRDRNVTSSSGASSASAESIPSAKTQEVSPPKRAGNVPDEKKKKARCDEDFGIRSNDAKRGFRGSSSTKRSRAAEVHNLSERRRRDRINEKMRALQKLIPHCNKADKASMLDEAIGYLKSLQMQVQMMSMGCGMIPMMLPGMQQYMPHMGMGMNRPMIPFPNVFNSSTLPTTAAGPHMGPGFRFPAFQMPPHIPVPDISRTPHSSRSSASLSSSSHSPSMPGLMGPYQQFFGTQLMHSHFQQRLVNTSSIDKPTTSKAGETTPKELPGCSGNLSFVG